MNISRFFVDNKQLLFGVGLILATAFSYWHILHLDRGSVMQAPTKHQVDAFIHDGILERSNEQGLLEGKLIAPSLLHYSDNDRIDVTKPHVMIYASDRSEWLIDAEHGMTTSSLEKIVLKDKVVIIQPDKLHDKTTTMKTSELTVYPGKKYAETDKPVTIRQPGSTIHAIGLRANMKTGQVELLSNSRGNYDPAKNPAHRHD